MSKYNLYGSDLYPRRKYPGLCIKVAVVVGLILLLGHMTNRDIEHHAEIVREPLDCGPTIEMTIPIEPGVQA